MGIDNLSLFIAAGLLLNLTPGPGVLYIVANGLRGRPGCLFRHSPGAGRQSRLDAFFKTTFEEANHA
jgi:hypothetical protein